MPIPARLRPYQPDWRTVLAAVLTVLAFPPYDIRWLIFIALVPWFAALDRCMTWRQATLQGLWFSILMSVGGFHWVAYVLKAFANLPWPVAILGLVLYSLIGQPQFTLFAWAQWRIGRRFSSANTSAPRILAGGLLGGLAYAGLDWILPKLFVDTLGHALYSAPWMRQGADIGGAWLLTFMIWSWNETLWGIWKTFQSRGEPSAWPVWLRMRAQILFSAILITGLAGYGAWRSKQIEGLIANPERVVQFGVIQANIGDIDKLAAESGLRSAAHKVLSTYYSMTEQALALSPRPQVIVWPETSYPSTFRTPLSSIELARDQELESFVRRNKVPLLFGGYDTASGKDYNAFFFLSPTGDSGLSGKEDLQIYRKYVLLPFGEFIPFAENIRWIRQTFPQVGYFGRGPGPSLIRVLDFEVNPIICYEILFSDFVLDAARKGSRVILNITNDSWFGSWGEPQLHLALSVFRSIEARLPQVRSTNTGISALILPDGSITSATGLFRPEVMNLAVPLVASPKTLVVRWGDWFPRFALGVGLLALLSVIAQRLKARARDSAGV